MARPLPPPQAGSSRVFATMKHGHDVHTVEMLGEARPARSRSFFHFHGSRFVEIFFFALRLSGLFLHKWHGNSFQVAAGLPHMYAVLPRLVVCNPFFFTFLALLVIRVGMRFSSTVMRSTLKISIVIRIAIWNVISLMAGLNLHNPHGHLRSSFRFQGF